MIFQMVVLSFLLIVNTINTLREFQEPLSVWRKESQEGEKSKRLSDNIFGHSHKFTLSSELYYFS